MHNLINLSSDKVSFQKVKPDIVKIINILWVFLISLDLKGLLCSIEVLWYQSIDKSYSIVIELLSFFIRIEFEAVICLYSSIDVSKTEQMFYI